MSTGGQHGFAAARAGTRLFWAMACTLVLCACGCTEPELESYYGRHELPVVSASVNGTDVLAGMFTEAGSDVHFRRILVTSEMDSVDTIVWFPDDYHAPTEEVCEWFDQWLYDVPGRTLVFVGRDFDAAPLYWEKMKGRVGQDQQNSYGSREARSKRDARPPTDIPQDDLTCEWFHFESKPRSKIEQLGGPWANGIDASQTDIMLGTEILSYRRGDRLLTADGNPFVTRYAEPFWEGSQILMVANGSFLLNLPLVNHQDRELAGKLIAATGEPGRVVFLESGPGGPPIDPEHIDNSLWTLFGAWPLNVVLLQLAVVGVIFCFARWPIFGRPKQPPAESTSDFALHVAAVGQLLARTKDRQFALERASELDPAAGPAARPNESQSSSRKAIDRR